MLRKLIVLVTFLAVAGLTNPAVSRAEDSTQTCTTVTQYGGAVSYICGASTHVPIETGLGENLALVGALVLASSGVLLFLSQKTQRRSEVGCN